MGIRKDFLWRARNVLSARRLLMNLFTTHLVGTALASVRYRQSRYKVSAKLNGRGKPRPYDLCKIRYRAIGTKAYVHLLRSVVGTNFVACFGVIRD